MKLKGIKKGMTQIWTNDIIVPVTSVFVPGTKGALASLETGTKVTVAGTSKGKGFQGVVKRHGFSGGPKTHGTKDTHRTPGSIGWTGPQRVMPGKKMPGHAGNARVTVKNLKVAGVNADKEEILLRGAVPGPKEGIIELVSDIELQVPETEAAEAEAPQEEVSETETPQEEASAEAAPQEATPVEEAPQEEVSSEEAPEEAAPAPEPTPEETNAPDKDKS